MRKKSNGLGNILGLGKTAHWNAVDDITIGISAGTLISLIHFRFNPARTNGVHTHTAAAPFCRKRSRQSDQSVL